MARKLKDIAVSENIPVLTASQLNRREEGYVRAAILAWKADVVILIKDESLVVNKSRRGPRTGRLCFCELSSPRGEVSVCHNRRRTKPDAFLT